MKKESFYIGWKNEMPAKNKKAIRILLCVVFIFIPLATLLLVIQQKPFNNYQFEFGQIKHFTGVYIDQPVPLLRITDNTLPEGISKEVLLVGYGKFGASGIMENIQEDVGPLNGMIITIQGTLIYGDGKGVIELSKVEKSLLSMDGNETFTPQRTTIADLNTKELSGEIIDPKCYFGVMKPAEGKIHKSCAIRCISGGIPPILKVSGKEGENNEYIILLGENGENINLEVLDFVAESITINGRIDTINGWDYLYFDPQEIKLN